MEDDGGGGDDGNGQKDRYQRQEGHIDRDEKDQHRALDREAEQVARLRQHRGIAGNRGDDPRTPDGFHLKQLGTPDLIHEPKAHLVNDALDFGGGRDRYVILRLDEQEERHHKKHRRPQARRVALAGALHARVDRRQNGCGADASQCRHEQELRQRAVHFAAYEADEGHKRADFGYTATTTLPHPLSEGSTRQA